MATILREYLALTYDKNVIKEAKEKGLAITVKALLQRADAPNQNNRVYPMTILQREVDNYKKAISEGRATGELDHPECKCEGNQILTRDGWKDFKDISEMEYIYTLNCETQEIEIQRINKKIVQPYKGIMYHLKGRNINTMDTPNHRYWIVDRYGKGSFVTVDEICKNRKKYNHSYIPKLGSWSSPEDMQIFVLKGCEEFSVHNKKEFIEKNSQTLLIDMKIWSSFLGLYLAEGNCSNRYNEFQKYNYQVKITQKDEEKKQKIRELLVKFPKEIKWEERECGDGKVDFYTYDKRLHSYLSPLGKSHEKYIPFEMKQLSPGYLQNILDWFVLGDGRIRECNEYTATEVFSTSKRLIEDLNEILFKSGGSGNIYVRKPYDRMIEGRLIKEENQKDLYFLHFSTTQGVYLDERFLDITPVQYEGNVYCVSVPNETFYCMDNGGKTYWSGNSSIVSLQNVSHVVREVWWQGNEVMGTVEILNTPKGKIAQELMEAGVRLGISSRGVGEVIKNESGHDVVDESFMLVAFDLVSEPSTHEAWLMRENKEIDIDTIRKMVPKVDRIHRIVNDILRNK